MPDPLQRLGGPGPRRLRYVEEKSAAEKRAEEEARKLLAEKERQRQIVDVFAREGLEGLQREGLGTGRLGAPVPLGTAAQRVGAGAAALVGGAFTQEGQEAFEAGVGGLVDPNVRRRIEAKRAAGISPESAMLETAQEGFGWPSGPVPQRLQDALRLAVPAGPLERMIPQRAGLQGAVGALAPIPVGGPLATGAVRGAGAGIKAAVPAARAAVGGAKGVATRYGERALETGAASAGIPAPRPQMKMARKAALLPAESSQRIKRFLSPKLELQRSQLEEQLEKAGFGMDAVAGLSPDEYFIIVEPPNPNRVNVMDAFQRLGVLDTGLDAATSAATRAFSRRGIGESPNVPLGGGFLYFRNMDDAQAFFQTGEYKRPDIHFKANRPNAQRLYELGPQPKPKVSPARTGLPRAPARTTTATIDKEAAAQEKRLLAFTQASRAANIYRELGGLGGSNLPRSEALRKELVALPQEARDLAQKRPELADIAITERPAAEVARGQAEMPITAPAVSATKKVLPGREGMEVTRPTAAKEPTPLEINTLIEQGFVSREPNVKVSRIADDPRGNPRFEVTGQSALSVNRLQGEYSRKAGVTVQRTGIGTKRIFTFDRQTLARALEARATEPVRPAVPERPIPGIRQTTETVRPAARGTVKSYDVTITQGVIKPKGGVEGPFERTFTVQATTPGAAAKAVRDSGIRADTVSVTESAPPSAPSLPNPRIGQATPPVTQQAVPATAGAPPSPAAAPTVPVRRPGESGMSMGSPQPIKMDMGIPVYAEGGGYKVYDGKQFGKGFVVVETGHGEVASYPSIRRALDDFAERTRAAEPVRPPATGLPIAGIRRATGAARKPTTAAVPATAARPAPSMLPKPAMAARAPQPAPVTPAQPPAAQAAAGAGGTPPPQRPAAQAAGGVPPQQPGFAANIRLVKYPEETRASIKAWADAHPSEVQTARRGIRSDAQVRADAERLIEEAGGNPKKIIQSWKPGDAWNAEEITAIRGALADTAQRIADAQKAVRQADSTENQGRLLRAMYEGVEAQQVVHGVSAESGRALRAFRQPAKAFEGMTESERIIAIMKKVGPGSDDVKRLSDSLAAIDMNDPYQVGAMIRDFTKPNFWDYLIEYRTNAILFGPKTHIINGLSNAAQVFVSFTERGLAAGVERGLAPLYGRAPERFVGEMGAEMMGALSGIPEGIRVAAKVLKTGISPTDASKLEIRRQAFKGTLGRVIRAPSTALEMADAMFYNINYPAALNTLTYRQARMEGKSGAAILARMAELKANPSIRLMEEARRTAEYRLFRAELGPLGQALMRVRERHPWMKVIVPFVRTPTNIVKYGLERSPLGLANPSLWKNLGLFGGKPSAEASDQLARIVLGSSIAGVFALLYAAGRLTGRAPENAAERDRFYREGKVAYAVKVGDSWVQYQRLEPMNLTITQTASALDALRNDEKDGAAKLAFVVGNIARNSLDQPWLTGMSDVFKLLDEPERYGTQYAGRLGASFLPASSLLRTAAQVTDPTIRKPKSLPESLMASIPGLSRNVPPSLTAFGEEARRQSPGWSPIGVSRAQQSALDAELERLGEEIGFVGTSIGGVKLTPEQKRQYQVLAGQASYSRLASLVQDPLYAPLSDANKVRVIDSAINGAREGARAQMQVRLAEQAPAGPVKGKAIPLPRSATPTQTPQAPRPLPRRPVPIGATP